MDEGAISSNIAADVLAEMLAGGGDLVEIVDAKGAAPGIRARRAQPVIAWTSSPPTRTRQRPIAAARTASSASSSSQVMRQTGGKANPQLVRELLEAELK